ncbi:MAG: glutathione S-transferase N-terminal domain-containing protein [Rhodobacterales bacterium]|nr:glutathione S-transferase N-terminal domain-containing protein [Rhodobacterales bacterium]
MILFTNLTSPFARLARIAVIEKGMADRVEVRVIDPWGGDPGFVGSNAHERVPSLITDDGTGLSESAMVLHWLDHVAPEPPLFPQNDLALMLRQAGAALGAIDVMAAIIITRKSAPDFDSNPIGQKRFRTINAAFDRLEMGPPRDLAVSRFLAAFATATAMDFASFRFPDKDWLGARPALAAWRKRQAGRTSLDTTMPREA